jgi:hypothetical protein
VVVVVALASSTTAGASTQCGSTTFPTPSGSFTYRVAVVVGQVRCATANRVVGDLLAGHGVKHSSPKGHYTSVDGWRCSPAAGTATCTRAQKKIHASAVFG